MKFSKQSTSKPSTPSEPSAASPTIPQLKEALRKGGFDPERDFLEPRFWRYTVQVHRETPMRLATSLPKEPVSIEQIRAGMSARDQENAEALDVDSSINAHWKVGNETAKVILRRVL